MNPYNDVPRLKAGGNLSYLAFIRLVKKLWMDSHPDIPILPTADKSFAKYPIIAYRLDSRLAHPAEPKPRHREEIPTAPGQDAIIISGQKFQNLITFTIMTESDPYKAEVLIEMFENFMLEMQPAYKRLGASEVVYARRLPDEHDTRPGEGTNSRAVSYLFTEERLIVTRVPKLEELYINAKVYLGRQETEAYFTSFSIDAATPTSTIYVYGLSLSIGDWVAIETRPGETLPAQLSPGYYIISNIIQDSNSRQYTLSQGSNDATPSFSPISVIGPGGGSITWIPDFEVTTTIGDDFQALDN